MTGDPHRGSIGYCTPCQKLLYETRKKARQTIRWVHQGAGKRAYRCPENEQLWHVGELPRAVKEGRSTAKEWFGAGNELPPASWRKQSRRPPEST
jgi:hypothetical protein